MIINPYDLPPASSGRLGGIKANPKSETDVVEVKIGEDDKLYVPEGEAVSWDGILDKPSTVSGYGITDVYTKGEVNTALGNKTDKSMTYTKTETDSALANKLDASLKGANSGLAELDASGKVPSSQLPSYVDDVLEYADFENLPSSGESGKIYITIDNNKTYRWTGSAYVEISSSLALGESSSTAYRGDRGKEAYDLRHSHANKAILDATTASYTITEQNKLTGLANYDDSGIISSLSNKVDKVAGKGLSTNDYDNTEKSAVAENTSARHTHSNKAILDAITASFTTDLKTKVDLITTDGDGTKYFNDLGNYGFVKRIQNDDNSSFFEAGGEIYNGMIDDPANPTRGTVLVQDQDSMGMICFGSNGLYSLNLGSAAFLGSGFTDRIGFNNGVALAQVADGMTYERYKFSKTSALSDVDTVVRLKDLADKLDKKPNGTADLLDTNNKINTVYVPDFLLGQMLYGGSFVPATGVATLSSNAKTKLGTTSATITLTNNTTAITGYKANEGIYYLASANGTFATISFETGDWLISNGMGWTKIDNTDAVKTVAGKTGVVTLDKTDVGLGSVDNTADSAKPVSTQQATLIATKDVLPTVSHATGAGNGWRLVAKVDYSASTGDDRAVYRFKVKQGHGNGVSYVYWGDYIVGLGTSNQITCSGVLTKSDGTYGRCGYRVDAANKTIYFYIWTGQYSAYYTSDLTNLSPGTKGVVTWYTESAVTADTVTMGENAIYPIGNGRLALEAQIPTNFASAETTIATSGSVSQALTPNILYKFTSTTLTSLTITFGTPVSGKVNEYMFEFISGGATPSLNVPIGVKWIEEPSLEANMKYQVSILNNIGIIVGVEL